LWSIVRDPLSRLMNEPTVGSDECGADVKVIK
jgi:hypothetical protein